MHRMVSHAVRCILWGSASPFPMACSLHYDSTIYALLKSAVIPILRAAFCEFFHKVVKSSTNTHLSRPHAGAKAPAFWFMSCYAAYCALYRKVTTCARVQVSFGANLLLPTPSVMPFATAQLTAL